MKKLIIRAMLMSTLSQGAFGAGGGSGTRAVVTPATAPAVATPAAEADVLSPEEAARAVTYEEVGDIIEALAWLGGEEEEKAVQAAGGQPSSKKQKTAGKTIKITVNFQNGECFIFHVEPNTTIRQLKQKIFKSRGKNIDVFFEEGYEEELNDELNLKKDYSLIATVVEEGAEAVGAFDSLEQAKCGAVIAASQLEKAQFVAGLSAIERAYVLRQLAGVQQATAVAISTDVASAEAGADTGTQLSSATYIPEELVPVGSLGLNDQTKLAQVSQHYRNAVSNHRKYLKYLSINSLEELKSFLCHHDQYSSLTSLTLSLYENSIGDTGARPLAAAIGSLGSLKSLTLGLSENSIGDTGARPLAAAIGSLGSLKSLTLDLNSNHIEVAGAQSIAAAIGSLGSLTSLNLNLDNNNIEDDDADDLYDNLTEVLRVSLTSLTLEL